MSDVTETFDARKLLMDSTPGPWRWQGEDYRAGWGWQMLVGPKGEGLIIGEGHDGGPYPELRAHVPLDPALCITGLAAEGKPHANAVHVFGGGNADLIRAAPWLAARVLELEQENEILRLEIKRLGPMGKDTDDV
jgi:hypothetical protein